MVCPSPPCPASSPRRRRAHPRCDRCGVSGSRPAPLPLGRCRSHLRVERSHDPLPGRGTGGRALSLEVHAVVPAGTADLPPGVHAYQPVEHALVRVGPPPVGAVPAVIITGVLAHRLALPRARVPAHLLGRGDASLPGARAGRGGRTSRPALHRVPGSRAPRSRRCRRNRRVRGRRAHARERLAGLAAERTRCGRIDRPLPVEFPLVTAAHWAGVGTRWGKPWRPRRRSGDRAPRLTHGGRGDLPARFDAAHGSHSRRLAQGVRRCPRGRLPRHRPSTSSPSTLSRGCGPVCTAGRPCRRRCATGTCGRSCAGSR